VSTPPAEASAPALPPLPGRVTRGRCRHAARAERDDAVSVHKVRKNRAILFVHLRDVAPQGFFGKAGLFEQPRREAGGQRPFDQTRERGLAVGGIGQQGHQRSCVQKIND